MAIANSTAPTKCICYPVISFWIVFEEGVPWCCKSDYSLAQTIKPAIYVTTIVFIKNIISGGTGKGPDRMCMYTLNLFHL